MTDNIILQDGNLRITCNDASNTPPPDYPGTEFILVRPTDEDPWHVLCQTSGDHPVSPVVICRELNDSGDFRHLVPSGVEYFTTTFRRNILHIVADPGNPGDVLPESLLNDSDLISWVLGNVYVLDVEEYLPEFGMWRPAVHTRPVLVYNNAQALAEAPRLLESAKH